MKQYLDLGKRILEEGHWIENKRTGTRCLTLINADLTYDVDLNKVPILTTRKTFYKGAIAELLGYLRGYNSAAQFRAIGCNTWNMNANENESWLKNPNRIGEDDMGRVYGVQGRDWKNFKGESLDQLKKIYNNLKEHKDDRGEILTFWNPGEFQLGCLRPCMHTHQFSVVNETLYLNSFQRSADFLLGTVFNQIQCFVLLKLMAQITGLKPGKAFHKNVNIHIYENQYKVLQESKQFDRIPFESPSMEINPDIKTLEDVLTWVTPDDFKLIGYKHHTPIKYPFSV